MEIVPSCLKDYTYKVKGTGITLRTWGTQWATDMVARGATVPEGVYPIQRRLEATAWNDVCVFLKKELSLRKFSKKRAQNVLGARSKVVIGWLVGLLQGRSEVEGKMDSRTVSRESLAIELRNTDIRLLS